MDASGGYSQYDFVAQFYDHVVPYRTRQDVEFFVELARQCRGPILEVGCGTGRVLIPIARAGIDIVGLDLSDAMLSICRDKLSGEPAAVQARVQLVKADMRNFSLGRQFALATIPFRPFQHLTTVGDQLSCLRSIRRHLADGGKLILDLFNPDVRVLGNEDRATEFGDEPEFVMPDGRRVVRKHRNAAWDLYNQIADCELIYYVTHPDGRKERFVHQFQMRYLFRFEAEHLLFRCGFDVETVYAGYDKTPYGTRYPGELIFVARKS